MKMSSKVILVDKLNNPVGFFDKYEAHLSPGKLHRALSVVLYRNISDRPEILMQKRSLKKDLWPNFWSNTVCTHQTKGEKSKEAAQRRLGEELGIDVGSEQLIHVFDFIYKADYSDSLCEYEYDEVFAGLWDGDINTNPDEVSAVKWIGIEKLTAEIDKGTQNYTPWFIKIIKNPGFIKLLN